MKVNQVVNEHKKGVRAHIYNKKATTKAQGPVPLYGPGKHDAKLKPVKVAEDMAPGQAVGKVQQVNPDGTAVIQSPDGKTQTVQQTQLQQGDNNTLSMQVPKIQPGQQVDASKTKTGLNILPPRITSFKISIKLFPLFFFKNISKKSSKSFFIFYI
jgi:hypothetical protein